MIYILAGSYEEYKAYVKSRSLDYARTKYISSPRSIRGVRDLCVIACGTWSKRRHSAAIVEEVCENNGIITYVD